jgi:hypothetical protein
MSNEGSWLRWKLFGLLTRSRRVCPANAHSALIWRTRPLKEIGVDSACRSDCAAAGVCWCGNLRASQDGQPRAAVTA